MLFHALLYLKRLKFKKLREEIEILNGDQEDYENETDEQKRSMKILLKSILVVILFQDLKHDLFQYLLKRDTYRIQI